MLTQTVPPTVHSHTDYSDCSRCGHPQLSLKPTFFRLLISPLFRKGHSKCVLNPHHLYIKFLLMSSHSSRFFIFFYTLFHPATPTHNKEMHSGRHCVSQVIRPECLSVSDGYNFHFWCQNCLSKPYMARNVAHTHPFQPSGVKDL